MPKRHLSDDLCAVCGQKLPESSHVVVDNTSVNDDNEDDSGSISTPEKTYRLTCNHVYPLKFLHIFLALVESNISTLPIG